MKIKIVNEGQPGRMTRIFDADTGKSLDYVTRVEVALDISAEPPHAVIYQAFPLVEIIADAEVKQICPCCGRSVGDEQ
jgi:hypothetical protein